MDWKEFQDLATKAMSAHLGVDFTERNPTGFPKKFDMVSPDESVIGDAKFLTLVHGRSTPPAKLMEIAGHVWLLEKVRAKKRFLAFGNQREVPELWLRKYGVLAKDVEFYFIDNSGQVGKLA